MRAFSQVAVGDLFWHGGECWIRTESDGLWNARTQWRPDGLERLGQFEDDELVS